MTLFVASLSLPYTINFAVGDTESNNPATNAPQIRKSDQKPAIPNLIASLASNLGSKQSTPPPTPPSELAGDQFFLKAVIGSAAAAGGVGAPTAGGLAIPKARPGLARQLTQPASRAPSPPPVSILKARAGTRNEPDIQAVSGAPRPIHPPKRRGSIKDQSELFSKAEWTVEPAQSGNGGLRNAVNAAVEARSLEEVTWVGTLGMPTDVLLDATKDSIAEKLRDEYDSLTVFCKDGDFDGHYNHFCKQILWPVFHYQIPDNPKSKAYEDHSWIYYVALNQAFANVIIKNYKKGDKIWVHDYHLLLVPKMIREKIPDATIGFFLHVAFPSSEVFRCLAVRSQLLEGMLGANLVAFQTEEYSRHFLQTVNRLLRVEATMEGIHLEDRHVDVESLAIGIDPINLSKQREEATVEEFIKVIGERYHGKKLIVARDKMDHVRGVRQKMLSYELFLKSHPEWVGKVILIQVALSTSDLNEFQTSVLDIVSRINKNYASLSYQPVIFLHQDISFQQYLALLTLADAFFIDSLREGMNLTSHEYIFCQDEKQSPLIMSEFTGSSAFFGGSEISVNPWDYRQCSDAIFTALEMKDEERQTRWKELHEKVMQNTGAYWVTTFLRDLQKAWLADQKRGNISIPRLSVNAIGDGYTQANKRLFLLDWEGTLVQWGSPSSTILSSPQRVLDILNDLLLDSRNIVYVMSGRKPEDLERPFRLVAGLGLIAENGCFIRPHNSDHWIEMVDQTQLGWKKSVEEILEYYKERTPGSTVEQRHCSFMFHLDKAEDTALASRQAGECVNHVNDSCENQRVHAVPLEKSVVVEPQDYNKATAATKILDLIREEEEKENAGRAQGEMWVPEFMFVAGDDREDEVLFRWAIEYGKEKDIDHVVTVCASTKNSEAEATCNGVAGLLSALQKLTKFK